MRLLAGIVKLALFAALTFGFVVLYGYGSANFQQGVRTDWEALKALAETAPAALVAQITGSQNAPPAESPAPPPNAQ